MIDSLSMHFFAVIAGGLTAVASQAGQHADDPGAVRTDGFSALLIDAQLRARSVHVLTFSGTTITIADVAGGRTELPASECTALIPTPGGADAELGIGAASRGMISALGGSLLDAGADPALPLEKISERLNAAALGAVELVDGQRFPGSPVPTSGEEESVTWQHEKLGPLSIALDRVARAVAPGTNAIGLPDAPAKDDELILANGDRITGLILSLGDPLQIEKEDGTIVTLPQDRMGAALLANPRRRASGMMLWLDDGTVLAAERLSARGGDQFTVWPVESGQTQRETSGDGDGDGNGAAQPGSGAPSASYGVRSIRGVLFDAGRVVALSDLPILSQTPAPGRRTGEPVRRVNHPDDFAVGSNPTLGAWDLELPGPMEVRWSLPEQGTRIAGTIALRDDSRPWGDCDVIILLDGTEAWRSHLGGDKTAAAFNLDLMASGRSAREFVVRIEPGKYGPIKDQVIIRRGMILLR